MGWFYKILWISGRCQTFYYSNGQIRTEDNYKNTKLEGLSKYYYSNGQIEAIQNYKNGKLNGLNKYFYDNGQVKAEENYNNGELNGLSKYYYSNGQIEVEKTYKNDKLENSSNYYYNNGEIKDQTNTHFDTPPIRFSNYIIKSRDTIEQISKYYEINPLILIYSNEELEANISVGNQIKIPTKNKIIYTVKRGDTISSIAQRLGVQNIYIEKQVKRFVKLGDKLYIDFDTMNSN